MNPNAPGHGRQYVVTTQVTVTVLDERARLGEGRTDAARVSRAVGEPGEVFAEVAGGRAGSA